MDYEGQYLTYDNYKGLGGELDKVPFNILEFKARKKVDELTFGRLKNLPSQSEEVKRCIFELIGVLDKHENNKSIGVASESIDGYSISYQTNSTESEKAKSSETFNIIRTYLCDSTLADGTPYLYRG